MTKSVKDAIERNDMGAIIGGAVLIAGGFYLAPAYGFLATAYVLGELLAPKDKKKTPDLEYSHQVTGRQALAPTRVIYGQTRVGGVQTFMCLSGGRLEYFHQVICLAGHEIDDVTALYIDGKPVSLSDSLLNGANGQGRYSGLLYAKAYVGTTTQTADTDLINATRPGWRGLDTGVRLNGVNNLITVATDLSPFGLSGLNPNSCTWELFVTVRRVPAEGEYGWIIAITDGTDTWGLRVNAEAKLEWVDASGNGPAETIALTLGSEYHVECMASAAGQRIVLRAKTVVDDNSTGAAYDNNSGAPVEVRFGSDSTRNGYADIDIDNVRLWSEVRSDADRAADWYEDDPAEPSPTTLLENWKFDENTGTTAASTGSLGTTATLVSMLDSNFRGRGIAYVYVRLKFNKDVFPSGDPNITFDVRGAKVRDPRNSPVDYAWSNNWALCVADYLENSRYGLRAGAARINDTLLSAAANISDEAVNLAGGGTQARYTCDGVFTTDQTRKSMIEKLLTAGMGRVVIAGGQFHLYAGAYITPSITLTKDDMRGPISVQVNDSRADAFNAVRGTFADASQGYIVTDFPPVTNALYQTQDGGDRWWRDIELPFTDNAARAQRLAKIVLERGRQELSVEFPGMLSCMRLRPPLTTGITFDVLGWEDKTFEIASGHLAAERSGESGAPLLGYDLKLRETAAAVYDWNSGEETTVDLAPNTALPRVEPPVAPPVENLTATQVGLSVVLEWTEPENTDFQGYTIRYEPRTDTPVWESATPFTRIQYRTTRAEVSLPPGWWTVHVRAGARDAESAISGTVEILVNTGQEWSHATIVGDPFQFGSPLGSNIATRIAALDQERAAVIDSANDELFTVGFDGLSWAQIGNALSISGGTPRIKPLDGVGIALTQSGGAPFLGAYEFDGTDWSVVGNTLSLSGVLHATFGTNMAAVVVSGELRAYGFDGTDWVQIGNGLSLAGAATDGDGINSTDIALIVDGDLGCYRFDGTDWVQIGNGLAIGSASSAVTAINPADVLIQSNVDKTTRCYRFDGTDWVQIGPPLVDTTASANFGLASLNGLDVAGMYDIYLVKYRLAYSLPR